MPLSEPTEVPQATKKTVHLGNGVSDGFFLFAFPHRRITLNFNNFFPVFSWFLFFMKYMLCAQSGKD